MTDKINRANDELISKQLEATPIIIGLDKALSVIPGMTESTLLHAGPPLEWKNASGPMRGNIAAALFFEGKIKDVSQLDDLMLSGDIQLKACNDYHSVGPMAGVISPSMSVYICEDKKTNCRAFSSMSDNSLLGRGNSPRFGIYSPEVVAHLHWMETIQAPLLNAAIHSQSGIDMKTIISEALHMGDDCHTRIRAASFLYIKELCCSIIKASSKNPQNAIDVLDIMYTDMLVALNPIMATCKAINESTGPIENSTIVTTMARNGTEFGIKVSGLGDQWFTGPAQLAEGLFFPGFSSQDANPDLGDSAITETCGLGGMVMATAPAVVQFAGGTAQDAIHSTLDMYEICHDEHPIFSIPSLDFRGAPLGIDIRKVVEKQIYPKINTGVAHKDMGKTMIGAGTVLPPSDCFEKALEAFVRKKESVLT